MYSKADSYIIGFIYKKNLYMVEIEELQPRYTMIKKAVSNHKEKLQMYLTNKRKKEFLNKGAKFICSEMDFIQMNNLKNKGYTFERMITEMYGLEWARDNVRFDKQGDIQVDGKEIQIKFENAQIATIDTLRKIAMGN